MILFHIMKFWFFIVTVLIGITGCTVNPSNDDLGGRSVDEAIDHSSSPISREQAVAIARPQVSEREHWRDEVPIRNHITHTISYTARRINKGGWRVVAHSAVQENRLDGGGGNAYDPIPAVVIVIDMQGHIINYSHSSDPYFD